MNFEGKVLRGLSKIYFAGVALNVVVAWD